MNIAYLPYGHPRHAFEALARTPADMLHWPLGAPRDLRTAGDLTENDHLFMCLTSRALLADFRRLRCRVSVVMREPPAIQRRYYQLMPYIWWRFHRILTHNETILKRCRNAVFLAHGETSLRDPNLPETSKSARVSLIASAKASTEGQKLRHAVAEWARKEVPDLQMFGRKYQPVEDKSVGHAPFQFSVVIENSREKGYFTEKLIDCMLCGCVPIYWGAPDIEQFFDVRGIIVCTSEADIREAIRTVDLHDFEQRRSCLMYNRSQAMTYTDFRDSAARLLMSDDRNICPHRWIA